MPVFCFGAQETKWEGKNICAVIEEGRKYDTHDIDVAEMPFRMSCEEIIGHVPINLLTSKKQVGWFLESVDPRPSFMDDTFPLLEMPEADWTNIGCNLPVSTIMADNLDFVSPAARAIRNDNSSPNKVQLTSWTRQTVAGHDGKGSDLNGHTNGWKSVRKEC
jgi:beta-galactosidase